ncbi:MAG: zinc ABC transporter substrate-binding protein [Caldilineaceae bacterium]
MIQGRLRQLTQTAIVMALLAASVFVMAACGGAAEASGSGGADKLQIVTTTGQIGDIARHVGGEFVEVTALMGPGVDPHLYVASEGDVDRLVKADVILYNGLFLEAQMADVLRQIGERKPAIPVAEHIDPARLLPWANYADEYDPHVWFDVTLWMKAVEAVRDALSDADPDHAATYKANADAYLKELAELDAYVKEQAATVPAEQRVLVTAHDAFHYFGRAYGFDVKGLQGISTASEAGTADVRELADFIAEHKIPAIFIETSVPVRNVEALQAAVRDRGGDVAIGGQLYSDALGSPDGDAGTYVGMVRHNIDTIVKALRGG